MNILFHGGKEVTITPTWVDVNGNTVSAPSGVTLVVQDNSCRVVNNGNGSWTVYPSRNAAYGVVANFVVPTTSSTQTPKVEVSSSSQAVTATVRV